jgi:hypothetical protein
MNDVEELLRAELRARVAAAEADREPAVLLTGLEQQFRWTRLRRRWTGAALSAAAVAAAIAVPLALSSPAVPSRLGGITPGRAVPLSDTGVTPKGWAPVAYGNAQISVPSDWRVASRPVCGSASHGYVVVGTTATSLVVRNPRCKQAANMVAIQVLPKGQGQTRRRTGQINGIPLLGVRPLVRGSATFLAPTLHVLITARGPLANKVLGTLTRSPLSVVLAPGPRFPVPRSWRWHEFRGIRFPAPGGWALVRNGHWGCSPASAQDAVILIPSANFRRPRCPAVLPTAGQMTGHVGVLAAAGPYLSEGTRQFDACTLRHRVRLCYSEPSLGVLDLAVFVLGRQRATTVNIGLAGDGVVGRTIFDSVRAAN